MQKACLSQQANGLSLAQLFWNKFFLLLHFGFAKDISSAITAKLLAPRFKAVKGIKSILKGCFELKPLSNEHLMQKCAYVLFWFPKSTYSSARAACTQSILMRTHFLEYVLYRFYRFTFTFFTKDEEVEDGSWDNEDLPSH